MPGPQKYTFLRMVTSVLKNRVDQHVEEQLARALWLVRMCCFCGNYSSLTFHLVSPSLQISHTLFLTRQ